MSMGSDKWIGAAAGLLAGGALIWGATRLTGGGEDEGDGGDGSSLAEQARQSGRGDEQAPSSPEPAGDGYPCRDSDCDRSFHSPTTRDIHEQTHG